MRLLKTYFSNILICMIFCLSLSEICAAQYKENLNEALAQQAFVKNHKELQDYRIPANSWANLMLKKPTSFIDPSHSKKTLGKYFLDSLKCKHKLDNEKTYKLFKGKVDRSKFENIHNEVLKSMNKSIQQLFKEITVRNFNPVYETAREIAVKKQWEKIKKNIYPSGSEICQLKSGNLELWQIESRIQNRNRINNFFKENQRELRNDIKLAIQNALSQYDWQLNILYQINPDEGYTAESIAKEIIQAIEWKIKGRSGNKKYPVFACIKNSIFEIAQEKEKERFMTYIRVNKDKIIETNIKDDSIKATIMNNPDKHQNKDSSDAIFFSKYKSQIDSVLTTNYLIKAKATKNETFKKKISDLYSWEHQPDIHKTIKEKINNKTQLVRLEIIHEQFNKEFATEFDSLRLSETEIKSFRGLGYYERVDLLRSISRKKISDRRKSYIQEIQKIVLDSLKNIYGDASSAYARQIDLVKERQEPITSSPEYKKFKKIKERNEKLEALFSYYLADVTERWEEISRHKFEEKYNKIFDASKEEINVRIKEDLDKAPEHKVVIVQEKPTIYKQKEDKQKKNTQGSKEKSSGNEDKSGGGNEVGLGGKGKGGGKGDGIGPGIGGGGGRRGGKKSVGGKAQGELFRMRPMTVYASLVPQSLSGDASYDSNFEKGTGLRIGFSYELGSNFRAFLETGYSSFNRIEGIGYLRVMPINFGAIKAFPIIPRSDIYLRFQFAFSTKLSFIKTDLLNNFTENQNEPFTTNLFGLNIGLELIKCWEKFELGILTAYEFTFFPYSKILVPFVGENYNLINIGIILGYRF